MSSPTANQKMLANVRALREQGAPKERIDAELQRWRPAIDAENAADRKLSGVEKVGAVGAAMGQGATFGFLDDVADASLVAGKTGEEQRILVRQLREENPMLAMGAEIVGGMALPGGFLKAAPKAAGFARKAATVLGEGAIQGGLNAAGANEGSMLDRARAAIHGAGAGAAVGGAIAGVGRGLRGMVRTASRAAGNPVDDVIARLTPEDVQEMGSRLDDFRKAGVVDEAILADLSPDLASKLRAAATASKAVKDDLRTFTGGRAARLATKADDAFSEATGVPREGPHTAVDRMEREVSEAAAPWREAATEQAQSFDDALARADEMAATAGTGPKALPAPGQSVSARRDMPDYKEDIAWPGVPSRRPHETTSQEMAREALQAHRGDDPAASIVMQRGGTGVNVRSGSPTGEPLTIPPTQGPSLPDNPRLFAERLQSAGQNPDVAGALAEVGVSDVSKATHAQLTMAHSLLSEMQGSLMKAQGGPDKVLGLRRLARAKEALQAAIETRAPAFEGYRGVFHEGMNVKEAFELGHKMSRGESSLSAQELESLPESLRESFKAGVASGLRARDLPNVDIGPEARLQNLWEPVATADRAAAFRSMWGQENYARYIDRLRKMVSLQREQFGRGESTTIDKLLEQAKVNPTALAEVGSLLAGGRFTGAALYGAREGGRLLKAADAMRLTGKAKENAGKLMVRGDDAITAELKRMARDLMERQLPGPRGGSLSRGTKTAARFSGSLAGR
jgi:hypothetical protein